jgi:hypothetical protein
MHPPTLIFEQDDDEEEVEEWWSEVSPLGWQPSGLEDRPTGPFQAYHWSAPARSKGGAYQSISEAPGAFLYIPTSSAHLGESTWIRISSSENVSAPDIAVPGKGARRVAFAAPGPGLQAPLRLAYMRLLHTAKAFRAVCYV